jgi:predicted PolB exonuclease-like 3'-5' exonuclease
MLPKSLIESCNFIDIETTGSYQSLSDCKNKDPHLADLWIKRCKWLQKNIEAGESTEPSDLWENRSSLHPEFGKIVCVSFGVFSNDLSLERITSFYGDVEKEILEKTNKVLTNSRTKGFKIAGQNIKNFDIPYLGKRMIINGITPDPIIQTWNKKPWETSFVDLAEIFSFGAWGQTFSSLDLISHVLGVPSSKDSLDGSKVHESYWIKNEMEKIKEYCEKDVLCTMNCFKRMSS